MGQVPLCGRCAAPDLRPDVVLGGKNAIGKTGSCGVRSYGGFAWECSPSASCAGPQRREKMNVKGYLGLFAVATKLCRFDSGVRPEFAHELRRRQALVSIFRRSTRKLQKEKCAMKLKRPSFTSLVIALTLTLSALSTLGQEDVQKNSREIPRYKLVDLGTLGG